MLKGFREFIARGIVIDLATAVIIGAEFTGLVTAFTDNVVQPLVSRIGATPDSEYGFLRIPLGDNIAIDLNAVLSAAINFLIISAVVYFVQEAKGTRHQGGGAGDPTDSAHRDPRHIGRERQRLRQAWR